MASKKTKSFHTAWMSKIIREELVLKLVKLILVEN